MRERQALAAFMGALGAVALALVLASTTSRGLARAQVQAPQNDAGQAPQPPYDPLLCYQAADERTLLGRNQALRLCAGALDPAPVDCYVAADERLLISEDFSITLCQCARSLEPVACFERSQEETELSASQSLQLCNARSLWKLNGACVPWTGRRP